MGFNSAFKGLNFIHDEACYTIVIITKFIWPIPVAARSKVWGLRRLACWDCGFESRREHGCFSFMSVACCQVEVSASG